ncbi:YraN family protein [Massilia endophytica]|uniref:YraN family protein n=1 Tax=Massilia endophytica TaxID=2899220 RepID=UPI001E62D68D|nr:YraN family protein [Massilia endophytica]UGQ46461.1 YraN family protein [Massilia endophytica]
MPRTSQQEQGQRSEDAALDHLRLQGLQLVERNFRCKVGELDLIMRDRTHLVFVEVRHRRSRTYGGAAASITPAKQKRLLRAAQFYLMRFSQLPPCRFDVVALDGPQLTWLRNVLEM